MRGFVLVTPFIPAGFPPELVNVATIASVRVSPFGNHAEIRLTNGRCCVTEESVDEILERMREAQQ